MLKIYETLMTFFGGIVDTPKEGIEQHKKRDYLKSVIDRGKAHLLGSKWTQQRVDKARDKIINKAYAEYEQCELNKKGEKTAKSVIDRGKTHLLGHKWTHERINKASDEVISKTYAEQKKPELN